VPGNHLKTILCLLPLAAAAGIVQAQGLKPAAPVAIETVKDGLYLLTGEGGNVAAYVTGEGVILVDNMFDRDHEGILAAVASVTDEPIVYVLNTHQHDDHAGGDLKMLPFADVIAHKNVRDNLSDIQEPYYQDTPGLAIGLPNMTFTDEFAIHLGGKAVRAFWFGRGHTSGDVIVWFPDLGVIHTGDLFLGRAGPAAGQTSERPRGANIYVDYAQGGSFLDWTATLDRTLELEFDTVIPGHGPISTRIDVATFRADVAAMRDRIASLIDMGASKEQVLAIFESDYGWRSTGCPLSPPTPGCLQFQQIDALIRELAGD
jgi:cyclase